MGKLFHMPFLDLREWRWFLLRMGFVYTFCYAIVCQFIPNLVEHPGHHLFYWRFKDCNLSGLTHYSGLYSNLYLQRYSIWGNGSGSWQGGTTVTFFVLQSHLSLSHICLNIQAICSTVVGSVSVT